MDIFSLFSNYLLTISELFGYILGMQWGERKKLIFVDDFKCTCGCSMFWILNKDHLDKSAVITCDKCGAKYRNDGEGPGGKLMIYRQGALSDEWEIDTREGRVLN